MTARFFGWSSTFGSRWRRSHKTISKRPGRSRDLDSLRSRTSPAAETPPAGGERTHNGDCTHPPWVRDAPHLVGWDSARLAERLAQIAGLARTATVALAPVRRAVRANHRRLSRAKRIDTVVSRLRRLLSGSSRRHDDWCALRLSEDTLQRRVDLRQRTPPAARTASGSGQFLPPALQKREPRRPPKQAPPQNAP
jgi:hypothetical protein